MNALFAASARFPGRAKAVCRLLGLLLLLALLLPGQPPARAAENAAQAPAPQTATAEGKGSAKGFPLSRQGELEAVPATPLEKGQRILLTPFIISAPLDERLTPRDAKAWEQRFLSSVRRAFQLQGFAVQVIMPDAPATQDAPSGSQPASESPALPAKNGTAGNAAGKPPKAGGTVSPSEAAQAGSAAAVSTDASAGAASTTSTDASVAAPDQNANPEADTPAKAPSLQNSVTGTVSGDLHTITVYPLQVMAVAGRERMSVKAQVSGTVTLFQETEKRAFLVTRPVEGISNVNMQSAQNQDARNSAAQRALEEALDNGAANLVRALMEP